MCVIVVGGLPRSVTGVNENPRPVGTDRGPPQYVCEQGPHSHTKYSSEGQRVSMWQQAEQRRRLAKSAMVKLVAKDTERIA
jgi:hypothetical protein